MPTYIVGDIHGCYDKLTELLKVINFDTTKDELILTGDLVGRGPKSLEVIEIIMDLGESTARVLGNHDLNLVSIYFGFVDNKNKDNGLDAILTHKNAERYIEWIGDAPLIHVDKSKNLIISHAGIPPVWNLEEAVDYSLLFDSNRKKIGLKKILQKYHLNESLDWKQNMSIEEKIQYILFGCTKMKYCDDKGSFDNIQKGYNKNLTNKTQPWFKLRQQHNDKLHVYFGHWAALGFYSDANVTCCDSGCVWGGKLTAIKLNNEVGNLIIQV